MTYYYGFKVPPSGKARQDQPDLGDKNAPSAGPKEKKHFLSLLNPKGRKPAGGRQKVYAYYRPGSTKAEARESFLDLKDLGFNTENTSGRDVAQEEPAPPKARKPRAKGLSSQAAKRVLQLAGLALLLGLVAWSKSKTTAILQEATGIKLEKVRVEGTHYLSEADIVQAAALPLGENMFNLDLERASGRINKMDWVDRVFIERRLPHSILISIRERRPVALLDKGTLFGVDREGRILSPSPALMQEDLPLISGVSQAEDQAGNGTLKRALDFIAFLQKKDRALAKDVSEVNLSEPDSLKVTFVDGAQAVFHPPMTENELRRLALIRSDLGQKGKKARVMDFRYHDMAVVKTR